HDKLRIEYAILVHNTQVHLIPVVRQERRDIGYFPVPVLLYQVMQYLTQVFFTPEENAMDAGPYRSHADQRDIAEYIWESAVVGHQPPAQENDAVKPELLYEVKQHFLMIQVPYRRIDTEMPETHHVHAMLTGILIYAPGEQVVVFVV